MSEAIEEARQQPTWTDAELEQKLDEITLQNEKTNVKESQDWETDEKDSLTDKRGRRASTILVKQYHVKCKFIEEQIEEIIGHPLKKSNGVDEVAVFRKNMSSLRKDIRVFREEKRSRRNYSYLYGDQATITAEPPIVQPEGRLDVLTRLEDFLYDNIHPQEIPSFVNLPEVFPAFINVQVLDPNQRYKSMRVNRNDKAKDVIDTLLSKYSKYIDDLKPADQYGLKVVGRAQYLPPDIEMGKIGYVHQCYMVGEKIYFVVVDLSQIEVPVEAEYVDPEKVMDVAQAEIPEPPAVLENYKDAPSHTWSVMSLSDVGQKFRLKLKGIDRIRMPPARHGKPNPPSEACSVYTELTLYHGAEALCPSVFSPFRPYSAPRWNDWLYFNIQVKDIPRCAVLSVTLWMSRERMGQGGYGAGSNSPLGWVNIPLMDYMGFLHAGEVNRALWRNDQANPIGTCVDNWLEAHEAPLLRLDMDRYMCPVRYPPDEYTPAEPDPKPPTPTPEEAAQLQAIIAKDSLHVMTPQEKGLVWKYRDSLKTEPKALLKFLHGAVTWNHRPTVMEAHRLLREWAALEPLDALELLDAQHADQTVREYAVACLDRLPDADLSNYLLQLVQVLKYEPYHDSPLARFLLKRALCDNVNGHLFFWYLKSEMHVPEVSTRFSLLLEAYLRGCGFYQRDVLERQVALMQDLESLAQMVKQKVHAKQDRGEVKHSLQRQLAALEFRGPTPLPVNHMIEVCGIIPEKCRFMDSKKLPLWVVFQNADPMGDPVYMMYKSGDDLRQDMLTLQIMRIMDTLWQREGFDLRLIPYGCVATGDEMGMIEIVLNSSTASHIQKEVGGGAAAAFKDNNLTPWLRQWNPSDREYKLAQEVFVRSCAGYCVATYVLGIGDRHNDNVMLTRKGNFFHIDFGHFLGNFKKKFGFDRERTPFIFTPDMLAVMDGKGSALFKQFQEYSCEAYLLIRKKSAIFINLFAMMLSCGIPELKDPSDILYLRDMLSLDMSEDQARAKFGDLIEIALSTRRTQLNDFVHNLAH